MLRGGEDAAYKDTSRGAAWGWGKSTKHMPDSQEVADSQEIVESQEIVQAGGVVEEVDGGGDAPLPVEMHRMSEESLEADTLGMDGDSGVRTREVADVGRGEAKPDALGHVGGESTPNGIGGVPTPPRRSRSPRLRPRSRGSYAEFQKLHGMSGAWRHGKRSVFFPTVTIRARFARSISYARGGVLAVHIAPSWGHESYPK